MVRFKSRYVTVQIFSEGSKSPISDGEILKAIRVSVEETFGEFGGGKLARCLKVEYYNPSLDVFLVQCGAPHVKLLLASLFFITSIGTRSVSLRVLQQSGSIVHSKEALMRILHQWLEASTKQLQAVQMDSFDANRQLDFQLNSTSKNCRHFQSAVCEFIRALIEAADTERKCIESIREAKE